jgi:isoleucyl-tRNA synthetase
MESTTLTVTQLPVDPTYKEHDEQMCKFWDDNNIVTKINDLHNKSEQVIFMEGPPFISGSGKKEESKKESSGLHAGHCLVSEIKSCIFKYQHMTGHKCYPYTGTDNHGLPIENFVSKLLDLQTPSDIRNYGIPQFNQVCKETIMKYETLWDPVYKSIGRMVDLDHRYKTMDTNFMESVFWVFKTLWDKNLIYRGWKVLPYSYKTGTVLSNFEAGQNYKDITDVTAYCYFPLVSDPNTGFVAWTTTPWTLPCNVALCLNPDGKYVKVTDDKNRSYIVHENYVDNLHVKIVSQTVIGLGKDLCGLEYRPPFNYYPERTYKTITDPFVEITGGIGSGVVHLACSYGEIDYEVCMKNNIVTLDDVIKLCPIDDNGEFTDPIIDYKGKLVFDTNPIIIEYLMKQNLLVRKEKHKHSYPHSDRTGEPLIYRAMSSYFVRVTAIKDQLLEMNKKVNWIPRHVGAGRFQNWLENVKDWSISRSRFFGTPIPVWTSDDGLESVCIGSIDELVKLAKLDYRPTDLHPEFINQITITSESGKVLKPVPYVCDCIAEGTPISLSNGTAVPIESLANCDDYVLAFDKDNNGLTKAKPSVFKYRGERECIELLFEDGRKLVCTPKHRILVKNKKLENVWIFAKDLIVGETRIVTSINNPIVSTDSEIDWVLKTKTMMFTVKTYSEKCKSMAFARILGYMLTDGSFSKINACGRGTCVLGHQIDATNFVDDIELICKIRPSIYCCAKSGIYYVRLPNVMTDAILSLDGVQCGKRICQDAKIPSFLTDIKNKCPKIIKAEFLGGLFGGDGIVPALGHYTHKNGNKIKSGTLGQIGFVASKIASKMESLTAMFEEIKKMLQEFDIVGITINKKILSSSSKKEISKGIHNEKKYKLVLQIGANGHTKFTENIGVRYCVHKQMRITASTTWHAMRMSISNQNDRLIEKINELSDYVNIRNTAIVNGLSMSDLNSYIQRNTIMPVNKAYKFALKELETKEQIINRKYLVCGRNVHEHLQKLPNIASYCVEPPMEWLKNLDAIRFFETKPVDMTNKKHPRKATYAVNRDVTVIPTFTLKLIGRKSVGKKKVYDITVPTYESFVANGIVVHNCWFESGSVPYAQIHYPFENVHAFDNKEYLSDFVCEGIDQTRGWFYVLNILSTALFNKPAFKNVICTGLVLDKEGKKMSKRNGNFKDPLDIIETFGSDSVRMYLVGSSAVQADNLCFDEENIKIVKQKLIQWQNGIRFFIEHFLAFTKLGNKYNNEYNKTTNVFDQWILMRTNELVEKIRKNMDQFNVSQCVPLIYDFIEDFTNWYLKLNRPRIKGLEGKSEWNMSLSVTAHVILTVIKCITPFTPFLSEHVYQHIKTLDDKKQLSIHLCDYPSIEQYKFDVKLVENMNLFKNILTNVRALRSKKANTASIRKPIKKLYIAHDDQDFLDFIGTFEDILCTEVNCLELEINKASKYISFKVKPNMRGIAKKYKQHMKNIKVVMEQITQEQMIAFYKKNIQNIEVTIGGENLVFTSEEIDIISEVSATFGDGVLSMLNDSLIIAIDTNSDEKLLDQYIIRQFCMAVQNLRKESDIHPWDIIHVEFNSDNKYIEKLITSNGIECIKKLKCGLSVHDDAITQTGKFIAMKKYDVYDLDDKLCESVMIKLIKMN